MASYLPKIRPTTSAFKHRLLVPDDAPTGNHGYSEGAESPLIICFHGSGETCTPSWDGLAAKLVVETHCRVLLLDRGPGNLRPDDVAAQMWNYVHGASDTEANGFRFEGRLSVEYLRRVKQEQLKGPYILIAHSYGGAFARAFVQHEFSLRRLRRKTSFSDRVLGLVLVETGQEGGLDPALDKRQIRRAIMGNRPVCVIRGNIHLQKWRELEEKESAISSPEAETTDIAAQRHTLAVQRQMLLRVDAEDERLKRRQLGLSKNNRFVHIPDCGHHVIRDRPDEVVAAVQWVLENGMGDEEKISLWKLIQGRIRALSVRR
ncbi:Alpha/Beta hydrolase protein [Xylariaceae sp. AK1471]|nr:Alpha/Beta hydrolase protein [Xylariaceae sp. AK1471]